MSVRLTDYDECAVSMVEMNISRQRIIDRVD